MALRTGVLAALIALTPFACGEEDSGPTVLKLVLRTANGSGQDTYTLTCEPPGGSVPRAGRLCTTLADHPDEMLAKPAEGLCSFGVGSLDLEVEGTFRGEHVSTTLSFCGGNGRGMLLWIRGGKLPVPPSSPE
jgi:hypothetical protein